MMGRYTLTVTGAGGANPSMAFVAVETNHWFGGKLVQKSVYGALGSITSTSVLQDRMGSVGKYHPYGEEIGTPTANDREKFATYTRDSATGLDYADQRWHGPGSGRFLSADPYQASGGAGDPGSWNRYGYVGGDPANHNDPSGLDRYVVDQHAGLLCSVRIDHEGNRTTIGCVLTPVALGQLRDDFEQKGPGLISAYGDCNKSGTQREEDYLSRLANNYLPAIQAADQSGLPVSWVLGWAQSESGGFTLNAIASSNGNFFSQTVTQAGTTGGIDGAVACSAGTVLSSIFDGQTRHWACFPGFLESALAALLRPLGGPGSGYILPAGTTNAAQVILAGAGGANGNAAVGFQLLANSGYDRGNPGYGQGVAAAIGYVSKRLDCLRGIGAIR
jgi:RHS repeat-associated protein